MIQQGIAHQGFSFIEVLQYCPTYNKATPLLRYESHLYDISLRPEYNSEQKSQARSLLQDTEHLAMGVLYQDRTAIDFYNLQHYRKNSKAPVDEVEKITAIKTALCKSKSPQSKLSFWHVFRSHS